MDQEGDGGIPRAAWVALVEQSSFPFERLDGRRFCRNGIGFQAADEARLWVWEESLDVAGVSGLEKRLAWDGLSYDDARAAVQPARLRDDVELPAWTRTLEKVVEAGLRGRTLARRSSESRPPLAFEELLLPSVAAARGELDLRLERSLPESSPGCIDESAFADLERDLLDRLSYLAGRAFYERFDAQRSPGDRLLARYASDEPPGVPLSNALYREFVAAELGSGLWQFFVEFPVAARLIATTIDDWIEACAEFLRRLRVDLEAITGTFAADGGAAIGALVSLDSMKADRHQQGRTVMLLRFGSGLRLVYKPRPVAIGRAFAQLVDWCNAQGLAPALSALRVLERDGYGWAEYVQQGECESEVSAQRFFVRAGMLLALLHVLGATDCHYENLIATDAGLVLIDVETLLHAAPARFVGSAATESAQTLADELASSVLSTGLLPRWAFSRDRGVAQDVSGLGADAEQPILNRSRKLQRINSDLMAIVEEQSPLPLGKNAARLDGRVQSAADYHAEVADGFETMYRFLLAQREVISASGGPLQAFSALRNRFVFRATEVYARVLGQLTHPRYLRDGVDFWLGLEQLGKAFVVCDEKPSAWPLFGAELASLSRLDIPLFGADTSSDALELEDATSIAEFFVGSSYRQARTKLLTLTQSDLELQLQLVRGSLIAARARASDPVGSRWSARAQPALSADECLAAAIAIGDDLLTKAIRRADGKPNWLGLSYEPLANRYQLQLAPEQLYDGRVGIAVFLAALHRATGLPRFKQLALAALDPVRAELAAFDGAGWQRAFAFGTHGAVTGFGSVAYGLLKVSRFLAEPAILADSLLLAARFPPPSSRLDENVDVVGGSAGMLLVLLGLHAAAGDERLLAKAQLLGDHLLSARASVGGAPRAWSRLQMPQLAGFSHGAAGIALALTRLFAATRDARYLDAALEGVAFENTLFSPAQGNWLDRRPDLRVAGAAGEAAIYSMQWCNGAPGIALARLAMSEHAGSSAVEADLAAGLEATLAYGLGGPDHLCCGNMGRVEALLQGSAALGRDDYREAALRAAGAVVARARDSGAYRIFSNAPPGVTSAGFFVGTSGIGYQLLRLARQDLPSVLLFQ